MFVHSKFERKVIYVYYDGKQETLTKLAEMATSLNPVAIVTPVNEKFAKATWLEAAQHGQLTNPFFRYDQELLTKVSSFEAEFEELAADLLSHLIEEGDEGMHPYTIDKFLQSLIESCIEDTRSIIQLASAILHGQDAAAAEAAIHLYGKPDEHIVKAAKEMVKRLTVENSSEKDGDEFSAVRIANHFSLLMTKLGITGWDCWVDDHTLAIDVRDQTSTVYIPTNRRVDEFKLKKLSGHEINSRLLGSANCRALLDNFFDEDSDLRILTNWLAKSADETIYEGVAKYSDATIQAKYRTFEGVNPETPLPWYTLAIDYALRGHNFSDTAVYICNLLEHVGFNNEQACKKAWIYCRRIFRGASNTANPVYVFPKDFGYFAGFKLYEEAIPELRTVFRNFSSFSYPILKKYAPFLQEFVPTYQPLSIEEL